jgi:hypothetical protein
VSVAAPEPEEEPVPALALDLGELNREFGSLDLHRVAIGAMLLAEAGDAENLELMLADLSAPVLRQLVREVASFSIVMLAIRTNRAAIREGLALYALQLADK